MSATEIYKSGRFDATLLKMLAAYDEVMAIMLPSLGEERQQSYSPFLPISPTTGAVLQVPILERNVAAGTIVFRDPDNGDKLTEVPVTGGNVKCQWKADWALRWAALGIDYEMSGKDLIDSVKLSSAHLRGARRRAAGRLQLRALPRRERARRFRSRRATASPSRSGSTYASPESLSLYMFQRPRAAKKLYFDVIPKAVDEYFTFLDAYPAQDDDQRLGNPVWHIHSGRPPTIDMPITFAMLLNLASASNTHDKAVLWGFILRHVKGVTPADASRSSTSWSAMRCATTTTSSSRRRSSAQPDEVEREALAALDAKLAALARRRRPGDHPERDPRRGARHPALPGSRSGRDRPAARAFRSPGSRRSTRSCSGRSAGRASARSWRSTAFPRRGR